MKKFIKALSGILKINTIITLLVITCLAAATIAASYYMRQLSHDTASARVDEKTLADTVIVKKSLPCNRYYNEVLMY